MKWIISYLNSAVARRILGLFILCAMLPIVTLGVLSIYQVTGTLQKATHDRLHLASKNVGMTIIEGLNFLSDELKTLTTSRNMKSAFHLHASSRRPDVSLPLHFRALSLVENRTKIITISGTPCLPPPLNDATVKKLVSGSALTYSETYTDKPARIFITIALPDEKSAARLLVGEIDTEYLWELVRNTLPPLTAVTIVTAGGNQLYSSEHFPQSAGARTMDGLRQSPSGQFEWRHNGETWLSNYRSIFLKGAYLSEDWTVVLSQNSGEALSALNSFTRMFILVLVLSLLVVLYLSSVHIRRSLIPLVILREGTGNISRGDFVSQVKINSGDEFEELALSFNTMSKHLLLQFNSLEEMGRIIRAILSALERDKIIRAVLDNLQRVISCDQFALFVVDDDKQDTIGAYRKGTNGTVSVDVAFSSLDCLRVQTLPENTFLQRDGEFASLLSVFEGDGLTAFALLPIRLHQKLEGILAIGYRKEPEHPQEDLLRSRQIADQVAVAMANANLIKELAQLNWSTLISLARAVDANSHWTAGHSERVTDVSLQIGRHMGLSSEELELLHRGGLLHDIGKIGVPGYVLDKHDTLTDEEYTQLKSHTTKGAEILEPIPFYREVIPLVLQHHEYFNGEGYPHGLQGENISLGARILAVADVFDALLSNRPYRAGWEVDRVIAYIEERSGTQFDPVVVQAFLGIVVYHSKSAGNNYC